MTEHQPTNMDTLDQALSGLTEGQSFFVGGMEPNDLQVVRRRAAKLGFKVSMSYMRGTDEIFSGEVGTRVWHDGVIDQKHRGKP